MGLRVEPDEEFEGLDLAEHGMSAYPDFSTVSFGGGHPASQKVAVDPNAAGYVPEYKTGKAVS